MRGIISRKLNSLIPGGCHTYSKADNQFPDNSPQAISYGKAGYVFDNNKIKYLDCGMGLTSVSIGHANKFINYSVKREIDNGINFNRPSILELKTAKNFLDLVPQHQMIKFAKNGSTVTTAAVKLARAYTKRNYVVFPQEHPFFSYDDWFISKTNYNAGIPKEVSKFSLKYQQCNLESLKSIFKKYPKDIACVITEPEKNYCNISCDCKIKVKDFLKEAIKLTHKNGALFIVDEMVTGFKTYFPGSTVKYKLNADLTTWGKGIANGFSFCALTGKKKIMKLGGIKEKEKNKVFLISTTHGAESTSLAAAIATISFFKKYKVIKKNSFYMRTLIDKCKQIIDHQKMNLRINMIKSDWLLTFNFLDKKNNNCYKSKTLFMQEMIKKKILFQGFFFPCYEHNSKDIDIFVDGFKHAIKILKKAHIFGFKKFLKSKIVKPVFSKS